MATKKRLRDQHAEATREAVLASARDAFTEGGYVKTSLDVIAARAGVTKGAIYHHFRNKVEVFEAVYTAIAGELAQALRAHIAPLETPAERFQAAMDLMIEHADDPACRVILFRDGPVALSDRYRAIDDRHFLGLLKEELSALQAQGALEDTNIQVLGPMLLSAMIEGATLLGKAEDLAQARRDVREALRRLLVGVVG
ncbi:MAG: TetR/AcrR family transcriptional regulator [Bradymonadia bacterium]